MSEPRNRKGTPGHAEWLAKFRAKNNPRLEAAKSAKQAAAQMASLPSAEPQPGN